MGFSDYLLYRVAKHWPSPMEQFNKEHNVETGTDAHDMAYAQSQFDRKVKQGLGGTVLGKEVLEIGTGHGGIACYMATVGAKRVVAIDLNTKNLQIGRRFAKQLETELNATAPLRVEFLEMSADRTSFPDAQFDLVLADNVFEHFTDPEAVMREAYRVLRPGGGLLVPVFSSIYSKYGLHLKNGLKLPWANLLFSEKTIVRAMHRMAADTPVLLEVYPGLANNPQRVRDLRRYGDLNDITYREFKNMANRIGFQVSSFKPNTTRLGRVLTLLPLVKSSIVTDILSVGAAAYLKKK
jgi:ubiquinone/menaquinone biosynthesis C-methylase UbiE